MRRKSEALLADEALLARRLQELGLAGARNLEVHENASVMVSFTRRGVLRIHRGYAYASNKILSAVVSFVRPQTRSAAKQAERELLAFPVHDFVALKPAVRRQRGRTRPEDLPYIRKLQRCHRKLSDQYFGARLSRVKIRISGRMRSKLGEVALDEDTLRPLMITFSRQHIRNDSWDEVERTLLHEMVHQWQAENGLPVDHGATFRKKALEIGVDPAAVRDVRSRKGAA